MRCRIKVWTTGTVLILVQVFIQYIVVDTKNQPDLLNYIRSKTLHNDIPSNTGNAIGSFNRNDDNSFTNLLVRIPIWLTTTSANVNVDDGSLQSWNDRHCIDVSDGEDDVGMIFPNRRQRIEQNVILRRYDKYFLSSTTIRALGMSGGAGEVPVADSILFSDTQNTKSIYPTVLIPITEIHGCANVDSFFELFLKNNAKYSIYDKFLQLQGDTNLNVNQWTVIKDNKKNKRKQSNPTYTRIVRYIHPVTVPMAPPQASARREQTYTHYGLMNGIVVESKTYVDDVPMADCFYSAERMIITPGTIPNSVSIGVEFGITYIKKTLFKSIISKSTTNTVSDLYKDMVQYIKDSLDKEK